MLIILGPKELMAYYSTTKTFQYNRYQGCLPLTIHWQSFWSTVWANGNKITCLIYRKTDLQVRLKLVSMISLNGISDKFPLERSNQEYRLPFQLFCLFTQKDTFYILSNWIFQKLLVTGKETKVQNKNVDKTK